MIKRKLFALSTTIMLGLGSVFSIPAVKAESISDIQKQKASVQGERSGIQQNIKEADNEIVYLQGKQAKQNGQIQRIEQAINDNNNKINETKEKITETKSTINGLKDEVSVLEERISKRNEVLKERAVSFQESGGDVSYLEVLLGSSSFRDFVNRVGAVTTIVEADREILKQHEADKGELEVKKSAVEKKLANLTASKVELDGMLAQIKEQEAQAEGLKLDLNNKEKLIVALKANLLNKDEGLASQEKELQQEMLAEAEQLSAARKKAEESAADSPASSSGNVAKVPTDSSPKSQHAPVASVSYQGSGDKSVVVSAGNKYIGNSVYVFGGGRTASDIANGRFDCSGFVAWAYSQAGIRLTAHTDALKNAGQQISYSQIQPGDLVFFDTYKKDGHVGIYVGGGKFIGSQSSTGVAIASMTGGGYWTKQFNGRVVRI